MKKLNLEVILSLLLTGLIFAFIPSLPSAAQAKPFKRALVMAGGGLSPGYSIGIIEGVRAAGYEPDVIIVTCGASIGASIYHAFPSPNEALAYARSPQNLATLQSLITIDERMALRFKDKLDLAANNPGILPNLFTGNILNIPEVVPSTLPNESFRAQPGRPRLIIVGAQSSFGPQHVGTKMDGPPLFREVFFTDSDTARFLGGRRSSIKREYPDSYVDSQTQTITGVTLSQAARASVSDPYFINPARIGDRYYFTGAIDLFPTETAKDLADEVLVTYPKLDYSSYEVLAIDSAFGFDQSDAALRATRKSGIGWIKTQAQVNFDPSAVAIFLVNNLPSSSREFATRVDGQFSVGYHGALESTRAYLRRRR